VILYASAAEPETTVVRKDADSLTDNEVNELRAALTKLQQDDTNYNFERIGAFHGQPLWCGPDSTDRKACCQHGMATFPSWHRLLTKQFEAGLQRFGFSGGVPYWDWTGRLTGYPSLVGDKLDAAGSPNPFYDFEVEDTKTTRSDGEQLFTDVKFDEYSFVADQMMLAMEQVS
jgi:hypothetical protein